MISKKKIIIVSGTPGTGKSTLTEFLEKKLGFERLDLHEHYKKISTGYDRSAKCYDIDFIKFEKLVEEKINEVKKGLIIDTHISHLLSPKKVDLCIVMTCSDLKKLEKRMQERKYSQRKIRENLDVEIFQICLHEAKEKGHKILTFDSSKKSTQKKILEEIKKKIKI
jgi:adenylate kinase